MAYNPDALDAAGKAGRDATQKLIATATTPKSSIYDAPDKNGNSYLKGSDSLKNQGQDSMYLPPDANGASYRNSPDSLRNQGTNTMYQTNPDGTSSLINSDSTGADSGGSGGLPCVSASCVGPRQSSSDGLTAEPYVHNNVSPLGGGSFDSGYTVAKNGQVVGKGYGDVKLLGGGLYAAKMYMDFNYYIYDSSGKKISDKGYGSVDSLGDSGYFAANNENGYGTTTIHGPDLAPVKTVQTYQVNDYLSSTDFTKQVIGSTQVPGKAPDTGGIYLGGQQQYKKSTTQSDDFDAALKDAEIRPKKK